jgi:transcriptional regulator with XRE-family HTH domain
MAVLGKRLKVAREKKRLSQIEAAKLLGISNGTLSGYERNYRDPDTQTLEKMANLFEVSTDYLLGRTDDPRGHSKEDNEDVNIAFYNLNELTEEQKEIVQKQIEIFKKMNKGK